MPHLTDEFAFEQTTTVPSVPTVQDNGRSDRLQVDVPTAPGEFTTESPEAASILSDFSLSPAEVQSQLAALQSGFTAPAPPPDTPPPIDVPEEGGAVAGGGGATAAADFKTEQDQKAALTSLITGPIIASGSPFRVPGTEGYDPASALPGTIDQAAAAKIWADNAIAASGLIFTSEFPGQTADAWFKVGEDGSLIPANESDLQLIDWTNSLKRQAQQISQQDLKFTQERTLTLLEQRDSDLRTTITSRLQEELRIELERERRITAEAQAEAQGEQARLTLDREFALRGTEIEHKFTRILDELAVASAEDRFTEQVKRDLQLTIMDRQFEVDAALQTANFQFSAEQNALNRGLQLLSLQETGRAARAGEELRMLDIQEVSRAAQAREALQLQKFDLEKKQQKLEVFNLIARSPEMLYYLGISGGAHQFDDILGPDGVPLLDEVLARIQERPLANIQEFARLNAQGQGIEEFRIQARTGVQDPRAALRGEAPRAILAPQAQTAPIRLGRNPGEFRRPIGVSG